MKTVKQLFYEYPTQNLCNLLVFNVFISPFLCTFYVKHIEVPYTRKTIDFLVSWGKEEALIIDVGDDGCEDSAVKKKLKRPTASCFYNVITVPPIR